MSAEEILRVNLSILPVRTDCFNCLVKSSLQFSLALTNADAYLILDINFITGEFIAGLSFSQSIAG